MEAAMSTAKQIEMYQFFLHNLGRSCKCHTWEIKKAQHALSELKKSGFIMPKDSFLMLPLGWEILSGVCKNTMTAQSKFYFEFDVINSLKECSHRQDDFYCIEPKNIQGTKSSHHVIANPLEIMALARFDYLSRFSSNRTIVSHIGVGFHIPNNPISRIRIYKASADVKEHLYIKIQV